jgi:putative PIN family toxin of toxin-antitoxin system
MRVVVDSNVLVSAYFWGGVPGRVYDLVVDQQVRALVTAYTLRELQTVLVRPGFSRYHQKSGTDPQELVADYAALAVMVEPGVIPFGAVRDRKDRAILACAVGGRADVIVTGDRDLLVLEEFAGIPIVTPAAFLAILGAEPQG